MAARFDVPEATIHKDLAELRADFIRDTEQAWKKPGVGLTREDLEEPRLGGAASAAVPFGATSTEANRRALEHMAREHSSQREFMEETENAWRNPTIGVTRESGSLSRFRR